MPGGGLLESEGETEHRMRSGEDRGYVFSARRESGPRSDKGRLTADIRLRDLVATCTAEVTADAVFQVAGEGEQRRVQPAGREPHDPAIRYFEPPGRAGIIGTPAELPAAAIPVGELEGIRVVDIVLDLPHEAPPPGATGSSV